MDPAKADKAFEAAIGKDRYAIAQTMTASSPNVEPEYNAENEYEEESDGEIDEMSREVIKIVNVHKTYLLGIEGVPALRGVNLTV